MDFSGQVILAFLEEDDEKRVLFRVRPLLTCHGPISQEDIDSLPQEGFLRIAPDQKEQHTFKERMRTLGRLCLLDLRQSPENMGKVRPNKNYGTPRGDRHRYIIYSDAVQALKNQALYEVVPEDGRVTPLTPRYYLRAGGRIQGPYCKGGEPVCPASHSLPPDNDHLFFVDLPDGTSRMFYWPADAVFEEWAAAIEPEAAAASGQQPEEDSLPFSSQNAIGQQEDPAREAPLAAEDDDGPQASQEGPDRSWFYEAAAGFHQLLQDSGFALEETGAQRLLLLCLTAPRLHLVSHHVADSWLAADVIAGAFQCRGPKARKLHEKNLGDRLVFAGELFNTPVGQERFHRAPYATFRILPAAGWERAPAYSLRLDFESLFAQLVDHRQELTGESILRLEEIEQEAREQGKGLPLSLKRQVADFVSLAASFTKGGQKEALSVAALAWLAPYLEPQEDHPVEADI